MNGMIIKTQSGKMSWLWNEELVNKALNSGFKYLFNWVIVFFIKLERLSAR